MTSTNKETVEQILNQLYEAGEYCANNSENVILDGHTRSSIRKAKQALDNFYAAKYEAAMRAERDKIAIEVIEHLMDKTEKYKNEKGESRLVVTMKTLQKERIALFHQLKTNPTIKNNNRCTVKTTIKEQSND